MEKIGRICQIYKIHNVLTSQIYIGSSIDIKERIRRHFKDLKANIHHSLKMQRSFNKYGIENFKVEYLATCPEEYRHLLEQWFIDNNDCYYNNEKIVNKPSIGRIISEEQRESSRKRMLGNEYWKLTPPMSEENKLKQAERSRNRIWTDESRLKLSNSLKGKKNTLGKFHSIETKKKMSENNANKRSVLQFSLDDVFIKEWVTIAEAVRELKLEQAGISRCCQGKQKQTCGFKFKYK